MRSDKLLIIDDKALTYKDNSQSAIGRLTPDQQKCVEFYREINHFWAASGDDVLLIKDFSSFAYIFIHDSFNEPIIQGGLMEVLIEKLWPAPRVVLYSGSKDESARPKKVDSELTPGVSWYEIRRSQYIENLARFIDSAAVFGEYRIKYLYDRYGNPKMDKAQDLFSEVRRLLELSSGAAVASPAFDELLRLRGYTPTKEILARFADMTPEEFVQRIEKLIN